MADSQLTNRVQTVVSEILGADESWTLSPVDGGHQLTLSDRVVRLSEHDVPGESTRWVLALSADGDLVSKFGPYESTDALVDQLRVVLTSDVFYTVCCDGSPE